MVVIHSVLLCALRDLVARISATVGAWTVPQGSMVPPALSTEDQTFLLHSCLPHEILPGRWVSQRASEDELPMGLVLAGVQGACLLGLFLHLLDKSGTWNAPHGILPGLCLAEWRPAPGPGRSVLLLRAHTYITCPSSAWAARGHRVVISDLLHMTGDRESGWVYPGVWDSPAGCLTEDSRLWRVFPGHLSLFF